MNPFLSSSLNFNALVLYTFVYMYTYIIISTTPERANKEIIHKFGTCLAKKHVVGKKIA